MTSMRSAFLAVVALGLGLVTGCQTGTDTLASSARGPTDGGAVDDGSTAKADASDAPVDGAADGSACALTAPSNTCGLYAQCGCGATEACDIVTPSTGTVACVTPGSGSAGAPCGGPGQCARGLTCVVGTCHAICPTVGSECAPPRSGACVGGDTSLPNLQACLNACDLRDTAPCGGGTTAAGAVKCARIAGRTDCVQGGLRGPGVPCNGTLDCGAGLECVSDGTASKCRLWCQVGLGSTDCGVGGGACERLSPPAIVDGVEFGACP